MYYLMLNEKKVGPYSIKQMRNMWNSGQLTAETSFSLQSGSEWMPLAALAPVLEGAEEEKESGSVCAGQSMQDKMAMYQVGKKNMAVAVILNLFVPGVGYIYAGRPLLGAFVLMLCIGALLAVVVQQGFIPFFGITGLSLIAAIDGFLTVDKYNKKLAKRLGISAL